jgi:hypothetical protein
MRYQGGNARDIFAGKGLQTFKSPSEAICVILITIDSRKERLCEHFVSVRLLASCGLRLMLQASNGSGAAVAAGTPPALPDSADSPQAPALEEEDEDMPQYQQQQLHPAGAGMIGERLCIFNVAWLFPICILVDMGILGWLIVLPELLS